MDAVGNLSIGQVTNLMSYVLLIKESINIYFHTIYELLPWNAFDQVAIVYVYLIISMI